MINICKKLICIFSILSILLYTSACVRLSSKYDKDNILSSMQKYFTVEKAEGIAYNLALPSIEENKYAGIDTNCESYFIAPVDIHSGGKVYYKNPYMKLSMASLTKLMTALVVLENVEDLDIEYNVSTDAVDLDRDMSKADLKEGDTISVRELLYGLLIPSGNDAANVLAENMDGGVDNFVLLMNNEAERIGCLNTHFSNPSGLDNEYHFTTAYDLYIIITNLLKYPIFSEITKIRKHETEVKQLDGTMRKLEWDNTNYYIWGDYVITSRVNIKGGKTGTTTNAGNCLALVVESKIDNVDYISIMLHEESKSKLYKNMNNLLNKIG